MPALRDPDFRAQLRADADQPVPTIRLLEPYWRAFGKIFVLGDPPDYEPTVDKTVAARIARHRGVSEVEVALDLMLDNDGRGGAHTGVRSSIFAEGNLDSTRVMLESEATLSASPWPVRWWRFSHVGMICDGSFPTTLLTHWGRDRTRGKGLPLELL